MPTVDLSIDFDFFSREDDDWDWGHNENFPPSTQNEIWSTRYNFSAFNLFDETDVSIYADFNPTDIIKMLANKGFVLHNSRHVARRIGISDSHVEAFNFFAAPIHLIAPPDYLVNIDAHHDIFGEEYMPLNCGNWVRHMYNHWPNTKFIQVYPKWKDYELLECPWLEDEDSPRPSSLTKPPIPITLTTWKDLVLPEDLTVRKIFACRSGAWVPPHMDGLFVDMVKALAQLSTRTPVVLDSLLDRSAMVPSANDVMSKTKAFQELWKNYTQSLQPR